MLEEIRRTIGWFFVILLITMLVFFLALQSALLWQFFPSSGSFATFPGEKIAVLDLSGPIFEVQDKLDQIKRFREDETVRGLLVQVDSPGGAVGPSQELASAVRHFSRSTGRPVVTSIRSVGASGAYYVASSSDTIVANPGSIVGSIGVLVQFLEFKDLMGKIGVDYQVVKSGEFKDLGSPFREMNERERDVMRRVIMDSYEQFLTHVLENRPNLRRGRLEELADGRVLTGQQAQENGLVDQLGTRREALETLRDAAGVDDSARLWNPTERQFGFTQVGQRIASVLDELLARSDSGFRLLYMMPDWGAAVD
jgi:protease-4